MSLFAISTHFWRDPRNHAVFGSPALQKQAISLHFWAESLQGAVSRLMSRDDITLHRARRSVEVTEIEADDDIDDPDPMFMDF